VPRGERSRRYDSIALRAIANPPLSLFLRARFPKRQRSTRPFMLSARRGAASTCGTAFAMRRASWLRAIDEHDVIVMSPKSGSVRTRSDDHRKTDTTMESEMIVEAFENYAKFNGPWLQAWTDANSAAVASVRMAFGQLELAALTSRFMTQRLRAYADYDGRIEPLVRRLDKLTEQFGEDYARELREIYSSWHEILRQDRAATQAVSSIKPGERRGDESWDGSRREAERGDRTDDRRPDSAAH
jgi:hypothetical protein